MKFLKRIGVNLSSPKNPGLKGYITFYRLDSGRHYKVYYVEDKFYSSKEVCNKTNAIIKEVSSESQHHYSIDIFFEDPARYYFVSYHNSGTHFSD
tara:strand:+ start:936 stop:1220 length:285 start_codon:yes stop_codon:yes gene_type:complete